MRSCIARSSSGSCDGLTDETSSSPVIHDARPLDGYILSVSTRLFICLVSKRTTRSKRRSRPMEYQCLQTRIIERRAREEIVNSRSDAPPLGTENASPSRWVAIRKICFQSSYGSEGARKGRMLQSFSSEVLLSVHWRGMIPGVATPLCDFDRLAKRSVVLIQFGDVEMRLFESNTKPPQLLLIEGFICLACWTDFCRRFPSQYWIHREIKLSGWFSEPDEAEIQD